ncbi:MAG: hypothetical protein ACRDNF_04315 [Streptosporangiaceae bacterium]
MRVRVVCPGITATEFHLTQGDRSVEGDTPLAEGGGMPAADVVTMIVASPDLTAAFDFAHPDFSIPDLPDTVPLITQSDQEKSFPPAPGSTGPWSAWNWPTRG